MDGTLGTILPPVPGAPAGLSLGFEALQTSVRWALTLLLLASGIPIAVAAIRGAGRRLPELIGAATAGTIAEPMAGAFLDAIGLLSALRWSLTDVLIRVRGRLARP